MKPAVYLYGVPGQYENYLAALESAGAPFRERSPF